MRRVTAAVLGGLLAALLVATPAGAVDTVLASGPPGEPGIDNAYRVSPDGRFVVYRVEVDDGAQTSRHLWSVRLDDPASAPVALSDTSLPDGEVLAFAITPDSAGVVWVGDTRVDERHEAFHRPIDASGPQQVLHAPLPPGSDVLGVTVTPDASHALLVGDVRDDDVVELASVPLDGSGGLVVLHAAPVAGGDVDLRVVPTPDSSAVVLRGDLLVDGRHELFVAAVDGTAPAVRLHDEPVAGGEVGVTFDVTATHAVWVGDTVVDEEFDVVSRRLDLVGDQQVLSSRSAATGDVLGRLRLSPDGSTVVYRGDLAVATRFELFGAPVDGSGPQVALSGPSVAGGDVDLAFDVTPDGARAWFVGDVADDGVDALWSVPLDGSAARVLLSPAPKDVDTEFAPQVTADGQRVLFRADLDDDTHMDLWVTTVDGGGPLAQVEQTTLADGEVFEFTVSDDGSRVVYVGQLTASGDFDLYSRPVDRSADQVRLGDLSLVVFGTNFRITPDGRLVVRRLGDDLLATSDGQVPAIVRRSGPDRYATAAAVSAATFSPVVDVVYVATGEDFADALAAGPLAARDRAPVLLTRRAELPEVTRAEVARLRPRRVVVLGGPGAVDDAVVAALAALADDGATRLRGADRYATAAAVAAAFPAGGGVVHVTTGRDFPDALSGGALAGPASPILLTRRDELPAATVAQLERLAPSAVVILGGTAAVSAGVATALEDLTAADVRRLSGPDRFATSAAIAAEVTAPVDTLHVATGRAFPDALAGVPAAVRDGAPLLLVDTDAVPGVVAAEVARLAPRRIVVLGGTSTIAPGVVDDLALLLRAADE